MTALADRSVINMYRSAHFTKMYRLLLLCMAKKKSLFGHILGLAQQQHLKNVCSHNMHARILCLIRSQLKSEFFISLSLLALLSSHSLYPPLCFESKVPKFTYCETSTFKSNEILFCLKKAYNYLKKQLTL